MSETALKNLAFGSISWAILLALPVLLLTIDKSWSRVVLLSIYPICLALISRTNPFYISMEIILIISLLIGLFYVALNQNKNVKKALKNPAENKLVVNAVLWSVIGLFILLLVLIGWHKQLFRSSNFVKPATRA
jgi:Zn-dependent protease